MKLYVMLQTYDTYGFQPTLSLIPGFLLGRARDFGPAVSELTVTLHVAHAGRARRSLETEFASFHANLRSLPKVVFRRSRGQVAIDVASDVVDARTLERNRGLSLPLFRAGVAETVAALGLMRKRLTAKDDFRLEAFLSHCEKAQTRVPSTAKELAALAAEDEKRAAADEAAMSPWERLGIDWQDFHPKARSVLDNPFFWESSNDFSPNGNDTGADLLADYRRWLRRNPRRDPIGFYRALLRRWGLAEEPTEDHERSVVDDAAVALAFAELKLRAACRPAVAALARAAVRRQRQAAQKAKRWPHREERLRSLDLVEARLVRRKRP
jgi:uncharacterized protein YfeS